MSDTEEITKAEQGAVELFFTRPSLLKIARKAGIKSLADDCYHLIDTMMIDRIEKLVREGILVNKVRGGKVLTAEDVQVAAHLRGQNVTSGDALSFSKV